MLPMMAVAQDAPTRRAPQDAPAKVKPKTLKELVAEEKAQKAAETKGRKELRRIHCHKRTSCSSRTTYEVRPSGIL